MSSVRIYVVAHKEFYKPNSKIYSTLWVGDQKHDFRCKEACYYDDEGDNISNKNQYYNEMTALYWIWKNGQEEIEGLCHYRRFFYNPFHKGFFKTPLSKHYIKEYLLTSDIIVQLRADYGDKNLYEQYVDALPEVGLQITRQVIAEEFHEYLNIYDQVLQQNYMFSCNMFICKRELLCQYCEWVFPILFAIEPKLDYEGWNDFEKRTLGMLSERLFNVWLVYKELKVKEVPFGEVRICSRIKYVIQHLERR